MEALQKLFKENIVKWFADKGDETHRIDYSLTNTSTVIDLGGYKGEWSDLIFSRYKCNIHIFEPSLIFFKSISEKYKENSKIKSYNYGLGNCDTELFLSDEGDASSIFKEGENKEKIVIKDANVFFGFMRSVDLIKINIEGGEYDLLEYLLEKNIVNKIQNIQIQFHTFVDNCEQRRNNIQTKLSETHRLTYNYDFVWENWEKK